ncbi:methyltransferase domain-containing protein [Brevibacillus sp. M2.1A]|uniref:methyltransferase domain-containing protein n=1 Tax=unclassified Brevibacillus TaxID=2684853 RepID=UPI00156AC972|nr:MULTISPECIES: methyltransferase domain-containing protein [unclassified Brevibacillus]MCC8437311.1 methyltransferase domain-containing protein [Brevibacillus sp. M2.1A]MCE0450808.1 methyltransferase domain-containing protein [Brevibacillus sp. AF8]
MEGSYQIANIATNVEVEIERLKSQVELFWDKELKHYIEFGLTDGMSVIELGSGPGFVMEKVMQAFPNGRVTGLEIDPLLVDYSQNYLTKTQSDRFEIVAGSIMETGLPSDSYDFAITRLVLEHLPDPVGAVREVARLLKPGGKAVFIDNDFEMHIMTTPHVPELRELYDAYCAARYAEGGNPKIGRELPTVLKQGGLGKIDFEVICAHSELLGYEMFLKSEGVGIPVQLVRDGYLSSKALGKLSVAWRNMLNTEGHSILRQLYMAVGEKTV